MELDVYLKELRACPDGSASQDWNNSELFKSFGVYNNFLVLASLSAKELVETFLSEGRFVAIGGYSGIIYGLLYKPGSVKMQIEELIWTESKGRPTSFGCSDDFEHALLQKEKFFTRVTLFVSSPKMSGIVDDMKAMAIVIEDIALIAKKHKISLCFPKSARYPNFQGYPKEDTSRIVYYFPE